MAIVRVDLDVKQKGDGIETTVKGMRRIEGGQKKVRKGYQDIGASMVKMAAVATTAYAAIRTVTGALEAQARQEAAINKLNLALANQGNLTTGASQSLQQYAAELQKVSRFGDEAIIEAQALAATFGMNERQLRQTTKAALDFAAATGRELTPIINLLGKAFVGETGELSRYGIIIDKNIPKTEKFAEVIAQVNERFGGMAQADVATYSGQVEQLSNVWGDVQESLGRLVGFITGEGGNAFSQLIGWGERLQKVFGVELVLAWSEAQAQLGEMLMDITEKLAVVAQAMAKVTRSSTLADLARELRSTTFSLAYATAEARERGNRQVAGGTGGLQFENAERAARAVNEGVAAREKESRLIDAMNKWRERRLVEGATRAIGDLDLGSGGVATADVLAPLVQGAQAQLDALNAQADESSIARMDRIRAETEEWSSLLGDLSHQFQLFGDSVTQGIGQVAGAIAGIVTNIGNLQTSQGTGWKGLLGKVSTGLGIAGAAFGIGKTIFGGIKSLFGGKSAEEKAAERAAKEAEKLAKELAEAEKRAKGLETAISGLGTLIENLTYTDAEGNVLSTFTDPAMGQHAAQLFSSTFWQTWREQGIEGLEKLRPMWDKMHAELVNLGLDPTGLGLGRIGDLMSQTADPRTRALLGVSRGAGQMVSGMMDAGFLSAADLAAASGMSQAAFAELIASGMDQATAAHAMSADLAALAQAYEAQGVALPQWLADALEGAGIDVLPTQLKVLESSLEVQKGILRAVGGGIPEYAEGGWSNAPTRGQLARLHGRELVIPEERIRRIAELGDGSMEVTPEGRVRPARRRRERPTQVDLTVAPTFHLDPLQTKEARKDLGDYLLDQLNRSLRNNPSIRAIVQDIARHEARRARA